MPGNRKTNYGEIGYFKIAMLTIFAISLTFGLVFLSAGRITYWQGWAFCGIIFFITISQLIIFTDKADLAK